MNNAIKAEQIKLLSTRSPYWCVGLVVVIGLAFGIIFGIGVSSTTDIDPDPQSFTVGITQIGVIVLMIMAVLAVTSEFRFGTIRTTFQAIPKRENVFFAKAAVYGGSAAVITFVLAVAAMVLGKLFSGDRADAIDLLGGDAIRQYWGIPVYVVLCVLIGLGLGALIRQTAGAIVVLLLWILAVETLLSAVPKVKVVAPYLPFNNAGNFIAPSAGGIDYPWNEYGSLLYFAVWGLVIFGAGVFVTKKRDA